MRKVLFEKTAYLHLREWMVQDKDTASKIFDLIDDIQKHPFTGLGKPEPLKYHLKGWWSRRITLEHRLVYQVNDEEIIVASCKYHYDT
jgi:toxin YoeB